MADKKISQLTAASAVGSTDLTVVIQGSATFKATMAQIATRIAAELTAQGIAGSLSIAGGAITPAATFTRATIAYWNGTPYAINEPRFVDPSQSGIRGALVEEAATNRLAANAQNFTTGSGGWAIQSGSSWVSTPGQADPYGGTGAVRVVTTGGTNAIKCYNGSSGTAAVGTKYSGMVWVKNNSAVPVVFYCMDGGGVTNTVTVNQADGWKLAKIENVTGAGAALQFMFGAPTAGQNLDFTAMEPMTVATAYIGTYHPPGATRNAETLTVPTAGLLTPSAGSVIIRFYWPGGAPTSTRVLFFTSANQALTRNEIAIDITATQVRAYTSDNSGGITNAAWTGTLSAGWHYIAIRYEAGRVSQWLDGVSKSEKTTGVFLPTALDTNFYLGHAKAGGNQINQPIAAAVTYTRSLSDSEMAAATLGNLPPDFTAYYDWTQGVLNPDEFAVDGRITAEHGLVVKSGVVSLPAASISDLALSSNAQLKTDPHDYPVYTKTTMPAHKQGRTVYVSDATGGAELCTSDGTNWRRQSDRSVLS